MYLHIVGVVLLYWLISISIVFLNKSLLSGKSDLNAPFFITWFQCVFAVLGCYVIYLLALISPYRDRFPKFELTISKCKQVLPLSIVFVAMIAFNNLYLANVNISFYYVGRSLSTVFSVILSFAILGQKTSISASLCCGVIIVGFWIGVDQEGDEGTATITDIVLGVLASLFASLNAVFTTRTLPAVEGSIWMLTIYNNINASLLFLPLIILNSEVKSVLNSEVTQTLNFWIEMLVASVFGLAIGYVIALQISLTSPLTHNISATAKSAVQTVLATYINSETKNFWWWISNATVLFGSMAYTWIKTWEAKQILTTKTQTTVI